MLKKMISLTLAMGLILPVSQAAQAAETAAVVHKVKQGESLWKISMAHKTTVSSIKKINKLSSGVIDPGQKLTISTKPVVYHKVASGDTLWLIAKRYHANIHDIVDINQLPLTTIYPGQLLRVPVSSSSAYTQKDIDLLAKLVQAEAGGESYKGKVAVAAVVLNRVQSDQYPNTIKGVIYQTYKNGSIFAFEPVQNGKIYNKANRSSYLAVYDALKGKDPSNGSLFFFNPKIAKSTWVDRVTIKNRIGNHAFGL